MRSNLVSFLEIAALPAVARNDSNVGLSQQYNFALGLSLGLPFCKCRTMSIFINTFHLIGAPGEIRTPDPLVRSQVLYPTELRAREGAHPTINALSR